MNLFLLSETITSGLHYELLTIISIIAVFCGLFVIITKNPIVSVLYLIGLFLTIAIYLMMLGIHFIGLSYLLVYVGAVSILFLFILMLINVRISELVTENNNSVPLAIIIGIIFIYTLYFAFPSQFKGVILSSKYFFLEDTSINYDQSLGFALNKIVEVYNSNISSYILIGVENGNTKHFVLGDNIKWQDLYFATTNTWDGALAELSHITSIGNILYTVYPMWLILTSLILLLAMVGAIVITIKQ